MLTYRARCWLNWLGEITQRCEIMSNQTRHQQSRIWFGWLHSDCYIPDITVMRTDCPHTIFFFFFLLTVCSLSLCQSHELMDETKAGEEVAVQRHRPQVWTGVWVHCHAGMGAVPGAQLRGVAHNRIYIYTQPPGLCWNTESLGRRERRAGWGYCVNLISRCHNFEQGRKKRVYVWTWGLGLGDRRDNCEKRKREWRFLKCSLKYGHTARFYVCFYVCRREWSVYI